MDPSGEPLFADYVKEEIMDPEEGEMRLNAGKDEEWPQGVKEEKVDPPVVKEEVEDGEEWRYGGRTTRKGPEFGQNPGLKRRNRTPGAEAIDYGTQKELNAEVKKEAKSPTSDQAEDSLPFAKLESFNAHVLFSNEYEEAVKEEEEEEESQKGAENRRNKTYSLPRLMEYSRIHRGERPFQWDIRQAAFIQSHQLKSHRQIHEDRPQWDLPGQKTSTADGAVDRQKCPFNGCSESLLSYADLVDHMKIHPGPLICGSCKKSFPSPSKLRRHYMTHTGEKPFPCSYCHMRFADSSHLTSHVRYHSGERPYECDACDFKTANPTTLKYHKLIHRKEEENPFPCSFCDERFPTSSELTDHQRTHPVARTYECVICEYKTSSSSDLKRRRFTHSGEKPFSCTGCDYKTADKSHLLRHRKRFSH